MWQMAITDAIVVGQQQEVFATIIKDGIGRFGITVIVAIDAADASVTSALLASAAPLMAAADAADAAIPVAGAINLVGTVVEL